jgi:2'-5' RNA ligase
MILSNTFVSMSLDEESMNNLEKYFIETPSIKKPLYVDKVHLTIFEGIEVENIPNNYFNDSFIVKKESFKFGLLPSGSNNENIALVLFLKSDEAVSLHNKIKSEFNLTSVYKDFLPHITLSYLFDKDTDLNSLKLPDFDLRFDSFNGCEIPDISNLEEELNSLFE